MTRVMSKLFPRLMSHSSGAPEPFDALSACFASGTISLSRQALAWQDLSSENLIRIAERERLLPALHARLQDLGILSDLPVEMAGLLSAVEELNLERNQAILGELATVAALLNEVGVEPVLLKGAAYCVSGVYVNPVARYLWDVDLLIPEPQLSTAVKALGRNGFEADQFDRLCRFRHHYPALRRPASVPFELHHSLGMGICNSLLPAADVFAQSVPQDFRGARIRLPSPEHLISHLIMHSQIQDPYRDRIWPLLRPMYDLTLLRRRFDAELDWSAIERRFRKAGQSGLLALHLLQVQEVLGVEPPFPIRLAGLTYFRWLRRKFLSAVPALRFLDPVYLYSTAIKRRLLLLRNALAVPGGWRHVVSELCTPQIYKRFFAEIVDGRTR